MLGIVCRAKRIKMPKITAWKCPHTRRLFEDENVYRNHLRRLSRERIAQRKRQAVCDSVKDIISATQYVNNVQELVDYIIKHQREFMIQGAFNTHFNDDVMHKALEKGWDIYFPKLETLQIVTTWRSEVSNSHSCPRNGYTNWSGRNEDGKDKCSYPGWHGEIITAYDANDRNIKIKKIGAKTWKEYEAPSISDMLSPFGVSSSLCGVCTGGGGGGITASKYSVSLFQSDFPNMEKAVTMAILRGGETATRYNGQRYDALDKIGKGIFKLEKKEKINV